MNLNQFDEEVKNGVVFVDFFATWCGPCKMLSPIIDEVSNEINDIKFLKVDVDESNEVATKYQIMSIPTLIIFKDGNVVNKHTGLLSKNDLINFINENK